MFYLPKQDALLLWCMNNFATTDSGGKNGGKEGSIGSDDDDTSLLLQVIKIKDGGLLVCANI